MSPCRTCDAKCCRYIALQIDTPRSKEEFEHIRWYLTHKNIYIYIEKRKWFMEVRNECHYLGKDHRCMIYDKRPLICRDHSVKDCEYLDSEFEHSQMFTSLDEFDAYLKKRFAKKTKSSKRQFSRRLLNSKKKRS